MKFSIENNTLLVVRECGDVAIKRQSAAAAGESHLLHHIKCALNAAAGVDLFIKKRMWKDGHMVDDYQQYVRTNGRMSIRKYASVYPDCGLMNNHFAISGLDDDWHENGKVRLAIVWGLTTGQDEEVGRELLTGIINRANFASQRVRISARRWFQRSYGNTYHSVDVWVGDNFVGQVPFTYGYGEQYLQTAHDILVKAGYFAGDYSDFTYARMEDRDRFIIFCQDVERKRDL